VTRRANGRRCIEIRLASPEIDDLGARSPEPIDGRRDLHRL
jgi:hypothetical protein